MWMAPFPGDVGTLIMEAVLLAPILLLGLLLFGRPAGQTATPERAAAYGGWLAHRPGGFSGQYRYNSPTRAPIWQTDYG